MEIGAKTVVDIIFGMAVDSGWERLSRSERVQRILREVGLRGGTPKAEFGEVYTYALAAYGVGRPHQLRALFRNRNVSALFRHAYEYRDPAFFRHELAEFLTSEVGRATIAPLPAAHALDEYTQFLAIFELMVDVSQSPVDMRLAHSLDDLDRQVREVTALVNDLLGGKAIVIAGSATQTDESLHARVMALAATMAALSNSVDTVTADQEATVEQIDALRSDIDTLRHNVNYQQQNERLRLAAVAVTATAAGAAAAVVIKHILDDLTPEPTYLEDDSVYTSRQRVNARGLKLRRRTWFDALLHPQSDPAVRMGEQPPWWLTSAALVVGAEGLDYEDRDDQLKETMSDEPLENAEGDNTNITSDELAEVDDDIDDDED